MKFYIKSLNDSNIFLPDNHGIIYWKELNIKTDANTAFEFDDENQDVNFIYRDANGNAFTKNINLKEFNLKLNYVLDKIRPLYNLNDNKNRIKEYKNNKQNQDYGIK